MRRLERVAPTAAEETGTVVGAAKLLFAPELVRSVAFRRLAYGVHDYGGVDRRLLDWKKGFERELAKHFFPLYCHGLDVNSACYVHFSRGLDVSAAEWEIIRALGGEVARRLGVPIEATGVFRWALAPELARPE